MGDYDQVEFLLKCVNERKITGEQAYAMLGSSGRDKPSSEVSPAGGSNSHHETRPATTGALGQQIERKTFSIYISSYSYLTLACAVASWKSLFISAEILGFLNKSL